MVSRVTDDDCPTVRITTNYRDDESGFLFWKGERFTALDGPPWDQGTCVKTAGEYVFIPAGTYEVLA